MIRSFFILVLFAMGLNTIGIFPMFRIQQEKARKEIKHRIKSGVPESQLKTFVFDSDQQPDWVRKGKEFRWESNSESHFYDVIRVETSGNKTIYHCISDDQESELFSNLDILVNRRAGNDPSVPIYLHLYQTQQCDVMLPGGHISNVLVCLPYSLLFAYSDSYIVYYPDTSTPPPDTV